MDSEGPVAAGRLLERIAALGRPEAGPKKLFKNVAHIHEGRHSMGDRPEKPLVVASYVRFIPNSKGMKSILMQKSEGPTILVSKKYQGTRIVVSVSPNTSSLDDFFTLMELEVEPDRIDRQADEVLNAIRVYVASQR